MEDERLGNFTSSQISALCTNGKAKGSIGKPFLTYVNEKRNEIRAGRSLSGEAKSSSLDWGNMLESFAHDLLPIDYELISRDRFKHPFLPWSGMPDGKIKDELVTDIKCPFTLTSFFKLLEAFEECEKFESYEPLKKASPEYFWQLVSNSELTGIEECELILFMPKFSMLGEIRDLSVFDNRSYWFHTKSDLEMPWTSDESEIKAITKYRFTPNQEDRDFLNERVESAAKLLKE